MNRGGEVRRSRRHLCACSRMTDRDDKGRGDSNRQMINKKVSAKTSEN